MTDVPVLENDEGDDEGEGFVCQDCIGDDVLSGEIAAAAKPHLCLGCGQTNRPAWSVGQLADRIAPVYEQLVGMAEHEPDIDPDSDNVSWVQHGSTPSELIGGMIEAADDKVAHAIVAHLSEASMWSVGHDMDTDWYDDSSEAYVLEVPDDPIYHRTWQAFCDGVKHERRFFNESARTLLGEILGPLLDGDEGAWAAAVRTIAPTDEDRFLYRGRQAHELAARKAIYARPIAELGAPPPRLATAGRMNVAGISAFYASGDPATCVAELRAPVGGVVVVAKFEIIRPLKLLDLTRIAEAVNALSYFHPDYLDRHNYVRFLRGFHDEIRKPIIPGRESLEYLPTQVIAEYLATRPQGAVDGVIFGSAQLSGARTNVVLFNFACTVEGADTEPRRQVLRANTYLGAPDDDPNHDEYVVLKPLPAAAPVPAPDPLSELNLGNPLDWDMPDEEPVAPTFEPALRFLPAGLVQVVVKAIDYETDSGLVIFSEGSEDDEGV